MSLAILFHLLCAQHVSATLWFIRWYFLHCKWNNAFPVWCWATRHCHVYKNIDCCTTTILRQIYVASRNKYVYLYIKCPMVNWNKRIFV